MNQTVHDFNESLAFSQSCADAPWWIDVYRTAFPGLVSAVSVRKDGWAQRGGIDRVLTLKSGKTLTVDEKVRKRVWPDFLLERWSDEVRQTPGWVQKDLACDYLAYAFKPSETCYLLPLLSLQRAWRLNGRDWIAAYPEKRSLNYGWTTLSVAVPIDVVLSALGDAMRVCWHKEETIDADPA